MELTLVLDGRTASGGTPLLMHNERLADPLDPIARALSAVNGKKKKTITDHEEMARIEFYGGLYTDPAIPRLDAVDGQRPILPAWNIHRTLRAGATRWRRGQDINRGVLPLAQFSELAYVPAAEGATAPRGAQALWEDGGYVLRHSAKVQMSRVMRTRPMFTDWQAELLVEVDTDLIDPDELEAWWKYAGRLGTGDWRPLYGRFQGTIKEMAA